MNLAVLTYADTANPLGIPPAWPAEVRELGEGTTLPAGDGWALMTSEEYATYLADHQAAYTAWLATYQALQAAAPDSREFRFDTHDWAKIEDWDGRTTGDPVLAKIQATEPTAFYDDVKYEVRLPDGTVLAKLSGRVDVQRYDGSTIHRLAKAPAGGRKWLDADDTVLAEYVPANTRWEWVADASDVTSSRWIIDPYNGTKMRLVRAMASFQHTATLQAAGAVRYRVMVASGAAVAAEYVYDDIPKLVNNADGSPTTYQLASGGVMQRHTYTYAETEVLVIDSALGMTMEIDLLGNLPITNTESAYGAFIGQEIGIRA